MPGHSRRVSGGRGDRAGKAQISLSFTTETDGDGDQRQGGKKGLRKPPTKVQGLSHTSPPRDPPNTEARAGLGLMLHTETSPAPSAPLLLHVLPAHVLLSPTAKSPPKPPHPHPKPSPRHLVQASFYGQPDPRDGRQLRSQPAGTGGLRWASTGRPRAGPDPGC